MMAMVNRLRPAVVVEIGTYKGGTLRCWSAVSPSSTVFISIDLPGGGFGGGYTENEAQTFRAGMKSGQTLECVRADSHDPATRDRVVSILASRSIDFLFIDGDHTYEGVKVDYGLYSGLVRPGGLVALHDIVPHPARASCRVHEFWAELRAGSPTEELVDRDGFDTWGGIGVVRA
jgi:predicted O-methyltransferase YrrM